jgi:hypothetical protein
MIQLFCHSYSVVIIHDPYSEICIWNFHTLYMKDLADWCEYNPVCIYNMCSGWLMTSKIFPGNYFWNWWRQVLKLPMIMIRYISFKCVFFKVHWWSSLWESCQDSFMAGASSYMTVLHRKMRLCPHWHLNLLSYASDHKAFAQLML